MPGQAGKKPPPSPKKTEASKKTKRNISKKLTRETLPQKVNRVLYFQQAATSHPEPFTVEETKTLVER